MASPLQQSASSQVAADGTCTIELRTPGQTLYTVEQISVQGTTGPGDVPGCQLLLNGNFVCGSAAGDNDTFSDPPPIYLAAVDVLAVAWSGMAPGTAVNVLFLGKVDQ